MAPPALAPALVAAGGLTDIDATLAGATVVLFVIFALVLGKFAWGPLLHLIEEREKSIRDAVLGSEKANAEAQTLLEKHKELVRDAGRERDELMKKSAAEAERLKQELHAQARSEAEQIVARAREQIEREKGLAIQELRAQVADIAMEAAARIVTSSLTPEAQKKLVDDYIRDLPKS
jgi:F-type H+-transporting ATPase subunit b